MRLYFLVFAVAVLLLAAGDMIATVAQFSGLKGAGVFGSLAGNLIAAAIVALLVERVLDGRQRRDERGRRTVALRQLQRRLTQHLNVLFHLRIAASQYGAELPSAGPGLWDTGSYGPTSSGPY